MVSKAFQNIKTVIAGKWVRVAFSYVLSAVFIYFIFKELNRFNWAQLRQSLVTLNFLGAFLLVILSNIVRSYRWVVILKPHNNARVNFGVSANATFLGMWFSLITTTGGNDLVKPYFLSRITGMRFWVVMGSCFVERFLDAIIVMAMITVLTCLYSAQLTDSFDISVVICGWVIFAVIIAALLFASFYKTVIAFITTRLRFIKLPGRLLQYGYDFAAGCTATLKKPRILLASFGITLVQWLILSLATWLMLLSSGLPLPMQKLYVAVLLNGYYGVAQALPGSVAGVGIINFYVFKYLILVAAYYGLAVTTGLNDTMIHFSIVIYLSNLLPDIVSGGIVYFKERRNIFAIKNAAV